MIRKLGACDCRGAAGKLLGGTWQRRRESTQLVTTGLILSPAPYPAGLYTATMPITRKRRIGRRAVMALAVMVLLLAWLMIREPPVVGKSKAVRPGMTRAEVETILGPASIWTGGAADATLFYGTPGILILLESMSREWVGAPPAMLDMRRFPVQVTLQNDRVIRIDRSGETEE